jgi:hypothetical protein
VLEPATVVEGRVVDASICGSGARAVAFLVRISLQGDPRTGDRAPDAPAATGDFRIDEVLRASGELRSASAPPPLFVIEIEVGRPATRIDTIRLPKAPHVVWAVVDGIGSLFRTHACGSRGSNGGAFDVTSDAYGGRTGRQFRPDVGASSRNRRRAGARNSVIE